MQTIVDTDEKDSPVVNAIRQYHILECGHRIHHATWWPSRGSVQQNHRESLKTKGDKARCYECPRRKA